MAPTIRLFGTLTSPYARRTRIILKELALAYQWVDTTTTEGQQALRGISPLWKVPALELDGQAIFDSRFIGQYLMIEYGSAAIAETKSQETENFISVVDGAMDALINTLYLGREGVTPTGTPYLEKHAQRAAAAMSWLAERVETTCPPGELSLASIGLATTLEWMVFRNAYPVANYPELVKWLAQFSERESFVATRPSDSA